LPEAPRLVLASASPRRKELLALLRVPFEIIPSAYEEQLPEAHPDPAALAVHLAGEKALDVARRNPGALVLGADTVVALGTRVYGKPADAADAARMLGELSGRTHEVITGVALMAPQGVRRFATRTSVRFRELEEAEIQAYCGTGEPLDKAGAYAIQGCGAVLIRGIEGDYPNVVGLPLAPLALLLRELGIPVLGKPGG
jgi:septum formation protein